MRTLENRPSMHSAEAKLLIGYARAESSSQGSLDAENYFQEEPNWSLFYEMAVRQGMVPRLYPWVNSPASSHVPRRFREKVKRFNITNTGRSLFLISKLCEVLRTLRDQDITAVPFKGPALSVALYNDASRRSYLDLDIMVRRGDVSKAIRVLKSHGYRPDYALQPAQEAPHIKNQYDLPFTHPSGNFTLELHWDIAPRYLGFSVDLPPMWERLHTIRLGRERMVSFAPEDHLILLCIHAGKHGWQRLAWICDISDLTKRHPCLNWDQVMEQARQSRCEKMMTLGLWLAWDLLNPPLPPEVVAWIRKDPSIMVSGARIQSDMFEKQGRESRPFEYFWAQWKLRDRWGDRLRYSLRFLSTPTIGDLLTLSLPPFLYPLYYVIRPARLLLKSLQR
jgi:Uncharacterised nucleotidyltransferase